MVEASETVELQDMAGGVGGTVRTEMITIKFLTDLKMWL